MKEKLDKTDLKILSLLQDDATITVAQISARVHLSQTPCWRRIQKLTDSGVITKRVALVDPDALGLGLTVFVEIETGAAPGNGGPPDYSGMERRAAASER